MLYEVITNRDGDLYAIRLNVSVVCDEGNEISNYVGIMADITSAKLQQAELVITSYSIHYTKLYDDLVANDDVSLSVGAGEILALLGENGAGIV